MLVQPLFCCTHYFVDLLPLFVGFALFVVLFVFAFVVDVAVGSCSSWYFGAAGFRLFFFLTLDHLHFLLLLFLILRFSFDYSNVEPFLLSLRDIGVIGT